VSRENGGRIIILVDAEGRSLGVGDKDLCHKGEGVLHAAFLVMAFSERNHLLLARRSANKPLWPGFWDGTIASHYGPGEDRVTRARDRMAEEIGFRCERVEPLFRFLYRAAYRDVGSEYELCDVYAARGVDVGRIAPDPGEISECRLLAPKDLAREASSRPADWAPWFQIALGKYAELFPDG